MASRAFRNLFQCQNGILLTFVRLRSGTVRSIWRSTRDKLRNCQRLREQSPDIASGASPVRAINSRVGARGLIVVAAAAHRLPLGNPSGT
jgi:hypothetical protein